jgi:hypothetical protein
MQRLTWFGLAFVALAALLHGTTPIAAQQPGPPPFRPTAGRFVPGPLASGPLCVLDTWTGRIHVAPAGAAFGDGVKAWVVDLAEASLWERPLARDVSAGHVLQHGMPLSGVGAGAAVFAWHTVDGQPAALDTRTGAHYAIVGPIGPGCSIVRTDLRMLTRSVREVRTGAGD